MADMGWREGDMERSQGNVVAIRMIRRRRRSWLGFLRGIGGEDG
jgi:hypothetical protein